MSRKVAFKEADVSRAIKGAKRAGMDVTEVRIDQSGNIVIASKPPLPSTAAEEAYSRWKAMKNARSA